MQGKWYFNTVQYVEQRLCINDERQPFDFTFVLIPVQDMYKRLCVISYLEMGDKNTDF